MRATDHRGLFVLGTFAITFVAVVAMAPLAASDGHGGQYAVEQGDQCVTTTAFADANRTVEDFYDYRHPDSEPSSRSYSSHGTLEYQQNDASILMMHEGADGVGFVVVHDRYWEGGENNEDATHGGSASFTVTGIDPGEGWAAEDDDYNGTADEFRHFDNRSEMNWIWSTGRTDGGAYSGLGDDFEVGIHPAWGEDAELQMDDERYSGNITEWQVVSATDGGSERTTLNSLDEPVTIRPGPCDADDGGGDGGTGDGDPEPDADLQVSDHTPEFGETEVTLDANGSNSTDSVDEFRWDLTGDGDAERTTGQAVVEHVFDADVGERNVTVTLVYDDGTSAADSVAVEVVDTTPPAAVLDAPNQTTAGEPIQLSGEGSTDNHRVDAYQWDFGDGENATGVDVDHTYDEVGTYEVDLVVVDPSGNENVTTATVEVSEQDDGNDTDESDDSDDGNDTDESDGTDDGSDGDGSEETDGDADERDGDEGDDTDESDESGGQEDETSSGGGSSGGGSSGTSGGATGGVDRSVSSGGGGSGSGTSSSSSAFSQTSEPVQATVLTDDEAVVLVAEDVEEGTTVEADVEFGDVVRLESVDLDVDEDVDELRVSLRPTETSVPGRFVERPAFQVDSNADIGAATYEFSVDRGLLEAAGVEAADLSVQAGGDEWQPSETEVAEGDDRVEATAKVDGVGTESGVAVGAEGPALYVDYVEAADPVADAPFDLRVTVRNTGDEVATLAAEPELRGDGPGALRLGIVETETDEPVQLDAGEETTLEASTTVSEPGEVSVRHGGADWTFTVAQRGREPSVVTVDAPETVEVGEQAAVDVVVENEHPVAIQGPVDLVVDGEAVATEVVRLQPGERETITFDRRFEDAGSHELGAGTAAASLEVTESDEYGPVMETVGDGAGFGAGLAVVAVLAAALCVAGARRFGTEAE